MLFVQKWNLYATANTFSISQFVTVLKSASLVSKLGHAQLADPFFRKGSDTSKPLPLGLSAPSPDHISFCEERNMEKKVAGVTPLAPRSAC